MFSRDRDRTHESGTTEGMIQWFTASSLCLFQRNLAPTEPAGNGVSTYLALIFGTLLSSQGTDASFVLTLSGFPPGASLRSCVSDSIRPFRRLIPRQRGLSSRPLGRSDVSNLS